MARPRCLSSCRPTSVWSARSKIWKERNLFCAYTRAFDRVAVLGDSIEGHTGCVNALSWALDGQVLLSGGDDTTIRIWRMDTTNAEDDYPFRCMTVIQTGHRGNIFNTKMLNDVGRIASVARDGQVRVFDIARSTGKSENGRETRYNTDDALIRLYRCHDDSVKRICTEDNPDMFLTVSEDGAVRQHDLRTPHRCSGGASCPAPLVKMPHELSTMSLSSLRPYMIVVAGESSFGYLFDRRQMGRHVREEWGVPLDERGLTSCVRRFGRAREPREESPGVTHVTGSRMSQSNGHEVLLSYSYDSIYRFSVFDEPRLECSRPPSLLPSNAKVTDPSQSPKLLTERLADDDVNTQLYDDSHRDSANEEEEEAPSLDGSAAYPRVPCILPRKRYKGHCNVRTVKDVNFVGPNDDFVVSGSDDGNLFMWDKETGTLRTILEGDGSVVNVIEGHPHLPLLAVSGIDTTIKLFAPSQRNPRENFSRMRDAEVIMRKNAENASRNARAMDVSLDLRHLLRAYRMARVQMAPEAEPGEEEPIPCTSQ